MSHLTAGSATAAPSGDTVAQPPSAGSAAIESISPEEPPLVALPVELQKTILEYLTSYGDKKSVCLACKQLNTIATPYLYRHMELDDRHLSHASMQSLTASHRGLRYVRSLRIVNPRIWIGSLSPQTVNAICRILSAIPNDTLTKFELPLSMEYYSSPQILSTIRLRQRTVNNYQFSGLRRGENWQEFISEEEDLARIEHLQLAIDPQEDCGQAADVLERTRDVKSLEVYFGDCNPLHDNTDFAALEMLFSKFAMSNSNKCAMLKSLRLSGVILPDDGAAVPRLIELRRLKHLQLVDSLNYTSLLEELVKLSLDLESFYIHDSDCEEVSESVHGFLRSLRSPKRISLAFGLPWDSSELFDWSTLHAYSGMIKIFSLDYTGTSVPYASLNDMVNFRRFLDSASGLQQLSLPGVRLIPVSPILVPGAYREGDGSLELLLHCLRTVRTLKTLALRVDLSSPPEPTSPDKNRDDGQHSAQLLVKCAADRALWKLADCCPQLTAVVLEYRYSGKVVAHAFIRSKQIDRNGRESIEGMAVETHMVKHYEPCSEILYPDTFVYG